MSEEKNAMIDSLNRIFTPELKSMGFSGSFPHYRRIINKKANFLTFQFDKNGGGFIIELANCHKPEFTTSWNKIISLNKLTSHDFDERQRIYPNINKKINGTEDWFRYDKKSFLLFGNKYEKLAKKLIEKIPLMEKYWNEINSSTPT